MDTYYGTRFQNIVPGQWFKTIGGRQLMRLAGCIRTQSYMAVDSKGVLVTAYDIVSAEYPDADMQWLSASKYNIILDMMVFPLKPDGRLDSDFELNRKKAKQ